MTSATNFGFHFLEASAQRNDTFAVVLLHLAITRPNDTAYRQISPGYFHLEHRPSRLSKSLSQH